MEQHLVLIDLSNYNLNQNHVETEELNKLTSCILKPFKQLNIFAYEDYYNVPEPILGAENATQLISTIDNFIKNKQGNSLNVNNDKFKDDNDIKKHLSQHGAYSIDSKFLNSSNNTSFTSEKELSEVKLKPYNYVLVSVNLYE